MERKNLDHESLARRERRNYPYILIAINLKAHSRRVKFPKL